MAGRGWLGVGRAVSLAMSVPTAGVLSPWADDSFLERVVVPDIWPDAVPRPMSRGEAMSVPAVSRSRHLICATIARLPLEAFRGDVLVPDQPYWCYGTDGQLGDLDDDARLRYGLPTGQSPFQRMLGTCDDLLFSGWSLWLVTTTGADGRPTRAVRVPYGLWDVDGDGDLVDQDGHPFDAGSAILIQGPHEGILTFGATTIRAAGTLETSAAEVARTPFRIGLHQTTDVALTTAERSAIVAETRRALADNHGVLFTNSALEVTEYRMDSAELLIGGRQAAALDVARHANVPGSMIDAEPTGASLTYSTTVGRNQQWLDYGLSAYLDAITAALSMDAVVPAGQRIAFDVSSLTSTIAPATGVPTQD
jgi:hypothetical protein